MCVEFRNGLTLSAVVLFDDLHHASAGGDGVGCDFMESAELVGAAMQQVGVRLHLVLLVQRFRQLLLLLAQKITHLNVLLDINF